MNSPAVTATTIDADVALMRSILKRIATGPELSKDISADEARAGMRLVLDGKVDPIQAAVFLIALRMKRETDDENCGALDAVRDVTQTVVAPVEELLDLGDPYNGFTRSLPPSPFLPRCWVSSTAPSPHSKVAKFSHCKPYPTLDQTIRSQTPLLKQPAFHCTPGLPPMPMNVRN